MGFLCWLQYKSSIKKMQPPPYWWNWVVTGFLFTYFFTPMVNKLVSIKFLTILIQCLSSIAGKILKCTFLAKKWQFLPFLLCMD